MCVNLCMCVCLCVCTAYLKEPRRHWPHWHALPRGKIPQNGAGSGCSTLKKMQQNTHKDRLKNENTSCRYLFHLPVVEVTRDIFSNTVFKGPLCRIQRFYGLE